MLFLKIFREKRFQHSYYGREVRISPISMCVVENLIPMCRYSPSTDDILKSKIFEYGKAVVRLDDSKPEQEPYLIFHTVCAIVRGLVEWMTGNDWWVESFVASECVNGYSSDTT